MGIDVEGAKAQMEAAMAERILILQQEADACAAAEAKRAEEKALWEGTSRQSFVLHYNELTAAGIPPEQAGITARKLVFGIGRR